MENALPMQERTRHTHPLSGRDEPVRHALESLRTLVLRQGGPVRQLQFFRVSGHYSLGARQMLEVLGVLHDEGLLETAAAAAAEQVAPPPPPPEDPVAAFVAASNAAPRLTRVQELELARAVQRGRQILAAVAGQPIASEPDRILIDDGVRAAQALVTANLRLVPAVARRASRRAHGDILADLMQQGVLGLHRATGTFDPERGHRFSSHAVWSVRLAMSRYLEQNARVVRLPSGVYQQLQRLTRLRRSLASAGRLSRRHHTGPLARRLGLAAAKVARLLDLEPDVLSLDQPADEAGESLGATLPSLDPPDWQFHERRELAETVVSFLAAIDSRLRLVLQLRFGLIDGTELTLDEIGRLLGVTRERVRQLERAALARLQEAGRARRLQEYLAGAG